MSNRRGDDDMDVGEEIVNGIVGNAISPTTLGCGLAAFGAAVVCVCAAFVTSRAQSVEVDVGQMKTAACACLNSSALPLIILMLVHLVK